MIYRDAKFMIDYSKKSIASAKAAMHEKKTTFCVGTSLLNPAKPFMDLWYRVNKDFPEYKLHLVPFEDDHEGILSEIAQLGKKFDFLIGVCDSKAWLNLCNMLPLGRYRKMIAVPREHRLAGKVLLTIECWQEVHPGLVSIPVNWDYSIPYGLLYSFDASEDVLRFVKAVEALF